jgi:hypothetical protein
MLHFKESNRLYRVHNSGHDERVGRIYRHARAGAVHAVQLYSVEAVRGAGHQHAQRYQTQTNVDYQYESLEHEARRDDVKIN